MKDILNLRGNILQQLITKDESMKLGIVVSKLNFQEEDFIMETIFVENTKFFGSISYCKMTNANQ